MYFATALSFADNTLPSFATTALFGFPLSSSRSTYSSQFSLSNLWNGSLYRNCLDLIFFCVDNASYSFHIAFFSCWILSTYFCILVSPSDSTSLWISSLDILSSNLVSFTFHFLSVISETSLFTILITESVNGLFSTTSICFSVSHSLLNSSSLASLSSISFLVCFSMSGLNILFTISFALSCILWITSKILAIVVLVSFAHCGSFTFAVHSTVFGASVVASSTLTSGVVISSPHSLNHSTVSP